MSRREVRDSAFKLMYEKLLRDDPIETLYSIVEEENIDEIILNDQVRELVDGTLLHADELDGIIARYSKTRALNRVPKLNLAILRIALYEILYDDGTPQSAAINEAVELAKNYTYQEDVSFINGLLGAYARDHAQTEHPTA
ncbi:MAG: transcription antitermination factor NusB [Oscillospiraceae bacterium]|nr:transcription antitermination factor NusB [Oscillospiraceae bacterium]